MKVGILIDRLNVGGVEKIAIEQVKALRQIGVDAHLVVLREKAVVKNAFPDILGDLQITYLDKRLPSFFRFSFPFPFFNFLSFFHLSYPFLLPFVVKRGEFDYLIVHGTYTSLTAVTLKKFKRIRFSSFIWDPASYIIERVYSNAAPRPVIWVMKKTATVLDKFLINRMDTVLVGGAAHNEFIHKMNPKKEIKIIYPSVHPVDKPLKKDNYAVMVTAWKQGKNPEYIFEILKEVPELNIKMVGKWVDPEYRKEFEKAAKESGLMGQIDIVGEVTEDQLSDYYAHAAVVLQTNDDRGFGMSALEGAGRGTTFIIPKDQGVCKLFTEGDDGFYTKEKDTKAIVPLIRKVINDKELATTMGARAWKKVRDNYSWEKHAVELNELVEKTLGR